MTIFAHDLLEQVFIWMTESNISISTSISARVSLRSVNVLMHGVWPSVCRLWMG